MDKKRLEIDVLDNNHFYYGQSIYSISTRDYKTFREKCPVCDGLSVIQYRGFELKCPYCEVGKVDTSATMLSISDYHVIEYIINKVELRGLETKENYKGDRILTDRFLPRATWSGFCKLGNSYNSIYTKNFGEYDMRKRDPETIPLREAKNACFYSKADANRFCRRIHERQAEMLAKFNADHGTSHEYPFKY
jgi:hypothetical protein